MLVLYTKIIPAICCCLLPGKNLCETKLFLDMKLRLGISFKSNGGFIVSTENSQNRTGQFYGSAKILLAAILTFRIALHSLKQVNWTRKNQKLYLTDKILCYKIWTFRFSAPSC